MIILTKVLIGLVAFEHLFILWIEMFAWTTKGKKIVSDSTDAFLQETKAMAANQGLYNGFLAIGLIWSLFISNANWSHYVSIYFLACVAVAGIYGALTASKSIFFKQGLPALITLVLVLLNL